MGVYDLSESEVKGMIKQYETEIARLETSNKRLKEGIEKHRNGLKDFYPDNPKWYDLQKELYALIEEKEG